MQYRLLGKTGMSVSEIGFGSWGIGGAVEDGPNSYGPTDDEESKRALRRAFDLGINFYDTSNLYGYGHSEELIGSVFKHERDKIIIASKAGWTKHGGAHDLSPGYIRECLEKSLKRLQTDYIDIYQLHSPPLQLLERNPETLAELAAMKAEGKIRAVAVSARNPEDGTVLLEKNIFESVQVNFNLTDQRAFENGFFDLAKKQGVGVIVRTPLAFGFLSGKVGDAQFNAGDHRSSWPEGQRRRWSDATDLFSSANQDKTKTPVQFALKFCLAFDAVSTVIPGMLHPQEVEENAGASDRRPLSPEEVAAVQNIYRQNQFFDPSLKNR